eukprot:jgi/Ulvmu1/3135/UM015_0175.1
MAKKTAQGRAKLAAKQSAAQANASDHAPSIDPKAGKVSAKTKKKVANKVQFLQKVQESAASTSRLKVKAAKQKCKPKKPLNDLTALNEALQDIMPVVQRQAGKAQSNPHTPRFKRSAARNQLQLQEQEHMAAVLKAQEFRADPIKALTTHLQLAMGPAPEPKALSRKVSNREKKLKKQLKKQRGLTGASEPDSDMS